MTPPPPPPARLVVAAFVSLRAAQNVTTAPGVPGRRGQPRRPPRSQPRRRPPVCPTRLVLLQVEAFGRRKKRELLAPPPGLPRSPRANGGARHLALTDPASGAPPTCCCRSRGMHEKVLVALERICRRAAGFCMCSWPASIPRLRTGPAFPPHTALLLFFSASRLYSTRSLVPGCSSWLTKAVAEATRVFFVAVVAKFLP